jgi:hypothetical protein
MARKRDEMPEASEDMVLAQRERLRELADSYGLWDVRCSPLGKLYVRIAPQAPTQRLTRFEQEASDIVGGWVTVFRDVRYPL